MRIIPPGPEIRDNLWGCREGMCIRLLAAHPLQPAHCCLLSSAARGPLEQCFLEQDPYITCMGHLGGSTSAPLNPGSKV